MSWVRERVRRLGLDVVRYPPVGSLLHQVKLVLQLHEVDLVVDVGAFRGDYALSLRRLGYSGPIISFEPVPDLATELEEAVSKDRLWFLRRQAVGARTAVRYMRVVPGRQLSSLAPFTSWAEQRFGISKRPVEVQVEVTNLDSILDEMPTGRAFVKIDAQGLDVEVLHGSNRSRKRIVGFQTEIPFVQCYETEESPYQHMRQFEEAGFRPVAFAPASRVGPGVLERRNFDCLFVREELID